MQIKANLKINNLTNWRSSHLKSLQMNYAKAPYFKEYVSDAFSPVGLMVDEWAESLPAGQERQVIEFYRNNPGAMNELRAPVYEEKVINFTLELVNLNEKKVSPKELIESAAGQEREQALFAGDDHDHDHDHGHVHGPDCDHEH